MTLPEIITYCLHKPGAWSDLPFDTQTMVIKVGSKMFCLIGSENSKRINLKCDPLKALELRKEHSAILPGYHMSKKHWNSILLDGSIAPDLLKQMIDHSYELVFNKLRLKEQKTITGN